MKKKFVKQEPLSDDKSSSPKLYLVKGGGKSGSNIEPNQPNGISDHIGISHPKELTPTSSEITNSEKPLVHLQAIEDVKLLHAGLITRTELRKRHPDTYKNWDDMKQRCKVDPDTGIQRIALDQSFVMFADFLRIVGPRPEPTWSLDRIDYTGPYSPDNVRWASKETQSRNRSNTIFLTSKGVTRPLVEWAEVLGVDANTLRGRKRAGWTDEEIIDGRRSWSSNSPSLPLTPQKHWAFTPWSPKIQEEMERRYQRHGWSGEHRLRFAERYSQERITQISKEAEMCCWPDHHTPSDAELSKCEELAQQHNIWQSIHRYNTERWSDEHRNMLYRQRELPAWVEKKLSEYA